MEISESFQEKGTNEKLVSATIFREEKLEEIVYTSNEISIGGDEMTKKLKIGFHDYQVQIYPQNGIGVPVGPFTFRCSYIGKTLGKVMPVKPETIMRRVQSLPEYQSKLYLQFKDGLENEQDTSERNWLNYFEVLVLFSDHIEDKKHLDLHFIPQSSETESTHISYDSGIFFGYYINVYLKILFPRIGFFLPKFCTIIIVSLGFALFYICQKTFIRTVS